MSYCLDVISEDSFYENLVLGVTKLLESNQRVTNVIVERKHPAERAALSSWEQRHSISLPDDLRQFYLSTDGFRLKWSYQYSNDEVLPVGCINVNPLGDLVLIPQLKEVIDKSASKSSSDRASAKAPQVCLINSDSNWSVWLLESDLTWTRLADSFVYYFRMALVHQGLPRWQAAFTKKGLPTWAEQLFLLMAPHLLERGEKYKPAQTSANDVQLNHIDPTIFKVQVNKHPNRGANAK